MTRFLAVWAIALPGFAAFLVGVGLGRFSYTPMLPVMVHADWLSAPQAAYVGAGNLIGSLIGALIAQAVGRRVGLVRAVRGSLVVCVVATLACALSWGFWWIAAWRIAIGIAGTMLTTLAAPVLVGSAPIAIRGAVSGAVFTGAGLGLALSGLLVPPLAEIGVATAWLGLSVATALATVIAWRGWPRVASPVAVAARRGRVLLSKPFLLLVAGYATDGIGFVPHGIFWVDFVARELGRGVEAGGWQWTLFGIGAALGPMICGRLADAIGFARTLHVVFGLKAVAILLPLIATGPLALTVSSMTVGALTPGLAAVISGAALELLGPAAHAPAWRWLMIAFAVTSTIGGYLFSLIFAMTGSYRVLFALGGAIIVLGGVLCAIATAGLPRATAGQ
jgi:MFS family permease